MLMTCKQAYSASKEFIKREKGRILYFHETGNFSRFLVNE